MYSVQKLKEKFEKNIGKELYHDYNKYQEKGENINIDFLTDLSNIQWFTEEKSSVDPHFNRFKEESKERNTELKSAISTPRSYTENFYNINQDVPAESIGKFSRPRLYGNQPIPYLQNNELVLRSKFAKEKLKNSNFIRDFPVDYWRQNKRNGTLSSFMQDSTLKKKSYGEQPDWCFTRGNGLLNQVVPDSGLDTEVPDINPSDVNTDRINFSVNSGFNTKNPLYYLTEAFKEKSLDKNRHHSAQIISNNLKEVRPKSLNLYKEMRNEKPYDMQEAKNYRRHLVNESHMNYMPSDYNVTSKHDYVEKTLLSKDAFFSNKKSDENQEELDNPKEKKERFSREEPIRTLKSRNIRNTFWRAEDQMDDETPEYQQLLQGKLDETFLLDVDNYEYYRSIKFKLEAATRRSDALMKQRREIDAQLFVAERERANLQSILKMAVLRKYSAAKDTRSSSRPYRQNVNSYK